MSELLLFITVFFHGMEISIFLSSQLDIRPENIYFGARNDSINAHETEAIRKI